MRACTISAAILLGVTACSTGRNSAARAAPECAGPWTATVTNNSVHDADVFVRRGESYTFIGMVTGGNSREFLTDTRSVYASPSSMSDRPGGMIGISGKNLRVEVTCPDTT